ncbi:hypothetical protein EYF80_039136 [Liparis tanakae]|uniref:Uncharacterized protein n=1 Tax=Liparis tanakae TaxID=230148 RepID=A0A4Z2GAP7_9TELE|nr:hypothetical protein EYF80_039136 [Liparis tanakae]
MIAALDRPLSIVRAEREALGPTPLGRADRSARRALCRSVCTAAPLFGLSGRAAGRLLSIVSDRPATRYRGSRRLPASLWDADAERKQGQEHRHRHTATQGSNSEESRWEERGELQK